jgi:hypothetical protein
VRQGFLDEIKAKNGGESARVLIPEDIVANEEIAE